MGTRELRVTIDLAEDHVHEDSQPSGNGEVSDHSSDTEEESLDTIYHSTSLNCFQFFPILAFDRKSRKIHKAAKTELRTMEQKFKQIKRKNLDLRKSIKPTCRKERAK